VGGMISRDGQSSKYRSSIFRIAGIKGVRGDDGKVLTKAYEGRETPGRKDI